MTLLRVLKQLLPRKILNCVFFLFIENDNRRGGGGRDYERRDGGGRDRRRDNDKKDSDRRGMTRDNPNDTRKYGHEDTRRDKSPPLVKKYEEAKVPVSCIFILLGKVIRFY